MSNLLSGGDNPGTTPLDDISGLKTRHIHTRAQLFEAEAMNIAKTVSKYFAVRPSRRKAPFTLAWAYRVHREMFGDVWKWAGHRRQTDGVNIGVPSHQIDSSLHELLEDLAAWRKFDTMDVIERAARLHHRAVQIHPFQNGNGRWSRMLTNIMLKQDGLAPTAWPENTVGTASEIRSEYLAAVRAADNHDIQPLINLHRRFTS